MPAVIGGIAMLQEYLRGVMRRADHHGPNVDQVALAIMGAIIWRHEGDIEVMEQDGDLKNVLWLRVNGNRYALSYKHEDGTIKVRERTTRGPVVKAFSNATPLAEVKAFFEGL